jgi:hypothetical protein
MTNNVNVENKQDASRILLEAVAHPSFRGITMKVHPVLRLIIFMLVIQLAFPLPLFAQVAGEFIEVLGDVTIQRAGKIIKPKVADSVHVKDVVATGEKSRAKLSMIDQSKLTLGPKARMEVREFYLKGKSRTGIFSLSMGKLHAVAVKSLGANARFDVHTPTAVAGVRGTEWISVVEAIQNATTSSFYTLQESIVVFNPALPTEVVTVSAGQFTVVAAGLGPTIPAAFSPAFLQSVTMELGAVAPAGATGTAGAVAAGAEAGAVTTAGVGTGTVAAGAAAAAVAAAAIAEATKTTTTTTHH